MNKYIYELEFKVRDYECDLQGIVNNSVYQNYLEHTRHMFLESNGVRMIDLAERGFSPVITKAEIEYRSSLQSRTDFVVNLELASLTKVKFVFMQEVRSLPEDELIISARIGLPEPSSILPDALAFQSLSKAYVPFSLTNKPLNRK